MKFGILFLCLFVAVTSAAPSLPSIIHAYEPKQIEQDRPIAVDFWPQREYEDPSDSYDDLYPDVAYTDDFYGSPPVEGTLQLNFDLNPAGVPALANDNVSGIIMRDLEERIADDIRRMKEDLLLFQRLFNVRPVVQTRPSWFLPWGLPGNSPGLLPGDTDDSMDSESSDEDSLGFDFDPFNRRVPEDSDDDDDDKFFGHFPFLGLDRPLFPSLPDLPGVGFANPADLPDNYKNETHQVHNINGTEVHVNNTVHKSSGDNINTFFHHQVIHFKSDEELPELPKLPEEPEAENPVTDVPVEEATEVVKDVHENEIDFVIPEVENEAGVGSFIPGPIPDVNPEINSSAQPPLDGARFESSAADEEDFLSSSRMLSKHGSRRVAARSLREFNPIVFPNDDPKAGPKLAAYVSNSLNTEREAEEFEKDDGKTRAPDLSKDTRVNRIHVNKQGMTQVDPDAEIFNYGLVMKEAQPRDGDI